MAMAASRSVREPTCRPSWRGVTAARVRSTGCLVCAAGVLCAPPLCRTVEERPPPPPVQLCSGCTGVRLDCRGFPQHARAQQGEAARARDDKSDARRRRLCEVTRYLSYAALFDAAPAALRISRLLGATCCAHGPRMTDPLHGSADIPAARCAVGWATLALPIESATDRNNSASCAGRPQSAAGACRYG